MKTGIRAKLIAIIVCVNMGVIAIMWIMAVLMFKPMYYASTQAQLGTVMDRVTQAITDEGAITRDTLEKISDFVNVKIISRISKLSPRFFYKLISVCIIVNTKICTPSEFIYILSKNSYAECVKSRHSKILKLFLC